MSGFFGFFLLNFVPPIPVSHHSGKSLHVHSKVASSFFTKSQTEHQGPDAQYSKWMSVDGEEYHVRFDDLQSKKDLFEKPVEGLIDIGKVE